MELSKDILKIRQRKYYDRLKVDGFPLIMQLPPFGNRWSIKLDSDHIEWDCWIIYDPLESLGSTYGIQYVCKEPFRNVSTRLLTSLARIQIRTREGGNYHFSPTLGDFLCHHFFFLLPLSSCVCVCANKSPAFEFFFLSSKFETYRAFNHSGKTDTRKIPIVLCKREGWAVRRLREPDILNLLWKRSFAGNNS